MLKEIEQQVVALVAGAVQGIDVSAAPLQDLAKGGRITVALRQLATSDVFQREQQSIGDPLLGLRRVLPVTFTLHITVRIRPSSDAASLDARERLLEHVARIAHRLSEPKVRAGDSFARADTAGFAIESFLLTEATIDEAATEGILSGSLRYRGTGTIWPPDQEPEPTGRIEQIHRTEAVMP
jgi:hypothetical protein